MRSSRLCPPTSVLLYAVLTSAYSVGCVTEDVDPIDGGIGGSGAAGGSAGSAGDGGTSSAGAGAGGTATSMGGSGGTGGIQSDPTFGVAAECPPIQQPLITDFTPAAGVVADAGVADAGAAAPVTNITFGDFTTTLSGGTYTYPAGVGDPYAVASDVSTGEWHLTGNIGTFSGLAVYFTGCNRIDASAYAGISFSIRGNVAMGQSMSFSVSSSSNDITHLWLNSQPVPPDPPAAANSGRCLPLAAQYDGSCASPVFTVPITPTETTIEVRWEDLTGGRPSASVDPAEITGIRWVFPNPPGAGTTTPTPYATELFIDDLSFIPKP